MYAVKRIVTARSVKVMLRVASNISHSSRADAHTHPLQRHSQGVRRCGRSARSGRRGRPPPRPARSRPAARGRRAPARGRPASGVELRGREAAFGTDEHGPVRRRPAASSANAGLPGAVGDDETGPGRERRRGRRRSSTTGIRARRLCIAASRATDRSRSTARAGLVGVPAHDGALGAQRGDPRHAELGRARRRRRRGRPSSARPRARRRSRGAGSTLDVAAARRARARRSAARRPRTRATRRCRRPR